MGETSGGLWAEALDAFAVELDRQRLAFAEGRHGDVQAFVFPEGDVPPAHSEQAHKLLLESLTLETAVASAFDDLARRRAISTRTISRARHSTVSRPTASFFDSIA